MKELFLLRGLPGSGKSTVAKCIAGENGWIREADMYFIDIHGNYKFEPAYIKNAHIWCQEEVEYFMNHEHDRIVVSNTFTQEWEMKPYFELAKKYKYRVYSLIVENRHGGINEHGVPVEKIEQMKNRFEILL